MKDIPAAEEELSEMVDEKSDDDKDETREESIIEVKNSVALEKKKKHEEVPDDLDEFYECIKDQI